MCILAASVLTEPSLRPGKESAPSPHNAPLLVSFPSTRKTERHSSRPPHLVLPALTGNQRHLRASTRLQASAPRRWKNKKKRSPTQTRSGERPGARHSSELLCFQLVPLFLRRGNVFVQMTNWTSSLSPGYFDRSGKKEELLENVEL